jgi:hypothetical protein
LCLSSRLLVCLSTFLQARPRAGQKQARRDVDLLIVIGCSFRCSWWFCLEELLVVSAE